MTLPTAAQPRWTTIRDFLRQPRVLSELQAALPRHMTPDKLVRVALTGMLRQPKLLECSVESLAGALIECARLGLYPGGAIGGAHLVPFKNTKTGQMEVQVIPDYRGLIDLATRGGDVVSIRAVPVYEGDAWEYEEGTSPRILHRPALDAPRDTEHLLYVYAVATLTGGETQFRVLTRAEVDAYRTRSRARDSGPWVTDYVAMAMKTAIRRLCNHLRLSPELARALELDDRHEAGESQALAAEMTHVLTPSEPPAIKPPAKPPTAKDAGGVAQVSPEEEPDEQRA